LQGASAAKAVAANVNATKSANNAFILISLKDDEGAVNSMIYAVSSKRSKMNPF
jgi:hypothetical protein